MTRLVTLLPGQINHAKKLFYNLVHMNLAFDISETGSGKTYIAISVAEDLIEMGLCNNIVFIVPNESYKIWNKFAVKIQVNTKVCTHSNISANLNSRTLIIIDEIQDLTSTGKNNSLNVLMSCAADHSSRVLVDSGTPFSDYAHAYMLFTSLKLVNLPTGKPKITELKKFNYRLFIESNIKKVEKLKSRIDEKFKCLYDDDLSVFNCPVYDGIIANRISAIHQVIMRVHSSECPRVLPSTLVISQSNHIYTMENSSGCRKLLKELKTAGGFLLGPILRQMHEYQLPYIADTAIKVLQENSNSKVIVSVLDNKHVIYLSLFFGKMGYSALTITSGIDQLARQTAQTLFNMHNLVYRVILVTHSVANCGISLHDNAPKDKHPAGFPRTLIAFIDVDPLRRTQLLGRHIRTGITSDTVSTILVSTIVDGEIEKNILFAKSKADTSLITMSLKSTDEASTFPVKQVTIDPVNFNTVVDVMNSMDEYVVE